MPLPPQTLAILKKQLDDADAKLADLEVTLSNMRRQGINAVDQENQVKELKSQIRQLRGFYTAEANRK